MALVIFHAFCAAVFATIAVVFVFCAAVFAAVATVFATVVLVVAASLIALICCINALSLLRIFAICCTPLSIAIALCTFNIALWTFSFSVPNKPIAPVAILVAAATPWTPWINASNFAVSEAKRFIASVASAIASLISPAAIAILVNSSVLLKPLRFMFAISCWSCLSCVFSDLPEFVMLSNSLEHLPNSVELYLRSSTAFLAFFTVWVRLSCPFKLIATSAIYGL